MPRPPAAKIELKAGDHVVYPTHGVGTVQGIETQEAAGIGLQVIVITFEENRMTLRVPVSKAATSGLRKLPRRKDDRAGAGDAEGPRAHQAHHVVPPRPGIRGEDQLRRPGRRSPRWCATCTATPASPTSPTPSGRSTSRRWTAWPREVAAIEKIDKPPASEKLVAFAKST